MPFGTMVRRSIESREKRIMSAISSVAATLLALGLPAEVAATVAVAPLPGGQASVTIGYEKGGRRKVVAETLTTLDGALAIVADRDRIAGLIALGVRAMPASQRPTLPDWVSASPEVARHDAMRARAAVLASGRAAGSTASAPADLPWAA
jgi:hypothetical protein